MDARMVRVGDDLALILDAKTWEQSGIDEATDVVVDVNDSGIHIRPVLEVHRRRVIDSARRMMDLHEETLRKLAL